MFQKSLVLSHTDFRILLNDLLEVYSTDFNTDEITLEDYLKTELENLLESYEADSFILFINNSVYDLDPSGLAYMMLDYLKQ